MFFEFLKLELRSAFKSPMVYIFTLLLAFILAMLIGSEVSIGGAVGNVHKNSPVVLTNIVLVFSLFGILFAAAFFNNAALRDHNNQFQEILFHTPIHKAAYFWGRFTGALILSCVPFIGIFIGAYIGSIVGPLGNWVQPEELGPFYWATIFNNYLIFVIPNMFLAGSIIFFLAHRFKSTIISFVGALALIVAYFVAGTLVSDIDNETIGALTDMLGVRAYSIFTKYFTSVESNTLSPTFTGLILKNRLIWLSLAAIVSVWSYIAFSFREKLRFKQSRRKSAAQLTVEPVFTKIPEVEVSFKSKISRLQFFSFYKANMLSILKSPVFAILTIFGLLLLIVSLVQGYDYRGLQSYPVTYKVMDDISSSTGLFLLIIIIFFSGELVWRDRISRIHEVINATAYGSVASVFAKVLSLISIAVILQLLFIFLGIVSQLVRGYTNIELSVYLIDFAVDTLPGYIILSAIFVLIQTLLSNRYVGYFVGILFVIGWGIILNTVLDWSSNMLDPGGSPGIFYSDMSGFGPGMTGTLWFNLYWTLFAAILVLVAGLFWPRSVVGSFRERLSTVRSHFDRKAKIGLGVIVAAWLAVAAFVYYNTEILNPYQSSDEREQQALEYEQNYKKYEKMELPSLTDINYFIDIYPNKRDVYVKAEAKLLNKKDSPIDSIFFNLFESWDTEIIIPGANLVFTDTVMGIEIYRLAQSLMPGDTMSMTITNAYITRGFGNSRGNTNILANGTFLNNGSILPVMGYAERFEISDRNKRNKYDLPKKKRMPELRKDCGELCMSNYLSDGKSDWVNVETVMSTSTDQIAVAPGSLIKEWEEDGRRYFHYKVEPSISKLLFLHVGALRSSKG